MKAKSYFILAIADKVETSIGLLTFEDGFPTEETAQQIYDQLDFQRAVESVMMTTPGASVHAFAHSLHPKDALKANWLPAPDCPFYMLMRLY